MQYMAEEPDRITTAKEIADKLNIPFEYLSKLLQTMIKSGLVESIQGTKGGYKLSHPANEITVEAIMSALGEKPSLVDCIAEHGQEDHTQCCRSAECGIKSPMVKLQAQMNNIFRNTTLAELCNNDKKKIMIEDLL